MINITLPDNSVRKYEAGVTGLEIAAGISEGLARNVLSAKVDGEVWDATRPIGHDAHVQLLTWNDKEGKSTMWHSSAHLMAEAIEALYPGAKFGIGPDIENGFYYDVDTGDRVITDADLVRIEAKMKELAKQKQTYRRRDVSKQEALDYFKKKGDEYKLELINELEDGKITFYESGGFVDLCRGPHLPDTSPIKAIKLTSIAGAYWRGDEKRKQLTRIYGITFPKNKELEEYLHLLEEAKKRDHRRLGKELEIFTFSQKVGSGLPLWLPKGAELRERLESYLKKVQKEAGYQPVITPHIGNVELYKISGHYQKYGQESFRPITTPVEGEAFFLKPMNCPHHCEIYNHKPHSYKDLPIRYAEFGTVYRYEQSGELHGLTRVRGFTQDDAHIFCTPDQVKDEFKGVMAIVMKIFKALDFDNFVTQISLRDPDNKEKYIGTDENWEKAERAILEVAEETGLETVVVPGEAAFYGPKMDFMVKDALGRSWQLGTIQVDYNLPDRFELEYIGSDNEKHRPVMIHRAPFGSMERFVAVLIEHCAGKFPLWLAPVQAIILPISEKYHTYAEKVLSLLQSSEVRAEIDTRSEKTGKKIRDAELKRIPFMLIVGEREEADGTISVRRQGEGDLGTFSVDGFSELIREEIRKLLSDKN
ncbi:MAG: threonine--tRNA ligase [Bacteroidales bacterium]|nr:threonine--tRNA ligase [Bacteroidales bacterium]MDD3527915.1 threonine--tRNA ligase [Bacteroidales bacterium]MDD4177680.1 threonine--tRNA ligase [Bacteroidales bacterium]NCU35801.1 threonine--tRNA ligase [Candidatus Falkowbacteria bacterium]